MISLLYPENYEPCGKILGERTIESLELNYIAKLICPYNTDFALKVLTELVTDESVIRWRQDILEDFINIPYLESLLYNSIHTIYEGSLSVFARTGSTQSFFELNDNISQMEAFVACMEECHRFAEEYGGRIKSAGIKSVLREIESNYNSEDFKKLTGEIDELKATLAKEIKSVTVGINMDKLMRPTEVMLLEVSHEPIRRKTMFERLLKKDKNAEPLSEIYARKYKDGQVAEVEKKLFSELDGLCGDYVRRANSAINRCYTECTDFLVRLSPQIDFYVGAKGLCERAAKLGLPVCRPEIVPKEKRLFICRDMYDPVLSNKTAAMVFRGDEAKPILTNDCRLDDNARIFLITGTNNGGKTTFIRAAAVNRILAQAGLNVCASEAEISPCSHIFTHYPLEEKVGIDTSRFTEECRELKRTIESADEYSLVLLNESLSSTNPYDSMIIAQELLKIFADIGCSLLYTTHILEMTEIPDKINVNTPKSRIGTLTAECDESGRPTYRITPAKPDFSRNARYIFEKYGISFEKYKNSSNK